MQVPSYYDFKPTYVELIQAGSILKWLKNHRAFYCTAKTTFSHDMRLHKIPQLSMLSKTNYICNQEDVLVSGHQSHVWFLAAPGI